MIESTVFIRYTDGTLEPIEVEEDVYTEEYLEGMKERFEAIEYVLRNLYSGKAIGKNIEEIYGHIIDTTIEDDYDILEQFSFVTITD